jgi:hypothetical protein
MNMKLTNIVSALVALGLVGGVSPRALAASAKEDKSAGPNPVVEATITNAVNAACPGAVIKKMARKTEEGVSFYEVKLAVNGIKMEADTTSDGTIIKTETAADMKTFPAAATAAITNAATGMEISKGELVTTFAQAVHDDSTGDTQVIHIVKLPKSVVSYEVDVAKNGNKGELEVGADGTVLASPKWAKEAKKEEAKKEGDKKAEKEDKD